MNAEQQLYWIVSELIKREYLVKMNGRYYVSPELFVESDDSLKKEGITR